MARADGGAMESGARHQHHAADTGRGRGATRFGDAGDAERCRLRLLRALFQHVDRRHVGIEQIEIGKCTRQQSRIREAGEFVVGRRPRHGDGALGQRVETIGPQIVGRDRRLLVADQHAQTDIVAFGALQDLDRAVTHVDRQRDRTHGDGIGGVGAGAARGARDRRGRIDRAVRTFAVCNWFMGRQRRTREKTGRMTKPRCACAARVSTRRMNLPSAGNHSSIMRYGGFEATRL